MNAAEKLSGAVLVDNHPHPLEKAQATPVLFPIFML